jgi:hypothetical protein
MTTSNWDKTEIQKQFGDCDTLQAVIERLETDYQSRGEVICEIRINGMLLGETDEVRLSSARVEEIESLAIASEKPVDLINGTLLSAADYVPRLHKACESASELLRGENQKLAQINFTELLDGCQWLSDTVVYLRSAADGVGKPIVNALDWRSAEVRFGEVIGEILAAFEKRDFVLVADLVEYELFNVLEFWSQIIQREQKARL